MSRNFPMLAALSLVLAGCGSSDEANSPPQPQKAPVQETVFDDLTATKDKARQDADRAMQQSKERNQKAIEQSESGRAP